jgi:hypothetical protein
VIGMLPFPFLGLSLTADQEPTRFPAKIIVAWDDGAVIERPISPDYAYFSKHYVQWRQGSGFLWTPVHWGFSEKTFQQIQRFQGDKDAHFVYREADSKLRLFFLAVRRDPTVRWNRASRRPSMMVLFDGGRNWTRRSMTKHVSKILTEKTAARLCWFFIDHLGIPKETHPSPISPEDKPENGSWSVNFFRYLGWGEEWGPTQAAPDLDTAHLAELGRPDSMDGYEQMAVTMLGQSEQSLAWIPEDEFQTMFGWGDPLQVEKKS